MTDKDFLQLIAFPSSRRSGLEAIKNSSLPLVLWGIGSLARSVKSCLERNGVSLSCCWVDHAPENDLQFEGLEVNSMEDIQKKYKLFNVVIGHSHYEMCNTVSDKYPAVNQCFYLVNVCYGIYYGIEYDFIKTNAFGYAYACDLLADDLSRQCLTAYLNCKMTEDIKYLLPCLIETAEYFDNPFFKIGDAENYVDIGAYDGDSLADFLISCGKVYDSVYAFEPEPESFVRLEQFVAENHLENVYLFKCGCWHKKEILSFNNSEEGSGIDASASGEIQVDALDHLLENKAVSLIKINFLHGVEETLLGAAALIREQSPNLIVTVGFDEWALLKIPKLIKEIRPDYNVYLRYGAAMPARLTLYATCGDRKDRG